MFFKKWALDFIQAGEINEWFIGWVDHSIINQKILIVLISNGGNEWGKRLENKAGNKAAEEVVVAL